MLDTDSVCVVSEVHIIMLKSARTMVRVFVGLVG